MEKSKRKRAPGLALQMICWVGVWIATTCLTYSAQAGWLHQFIAAGLFTALFGGIMWTIFSIIRGSQSSDRGYQPPNDQSGVSVPIEGPHC